MIEPSYCGYCDKVISDGNYWYVNKGEIFCDECFGCIILELFLNDL